MKISPVASLGTTVGSVEAPAAQNARVFKMATNATPLANEDFLKPPQELPIPTDIKEPQSEEATKPISPQFAALARQKRALQVKEREIADRERALATREQGGEWIPKALLKSDPLRVLQDASVSYDELANAIIAGQGNAEVNALKAEIAALKQGVDQKFTERETQEHQQTVTAIRQDVRALVAGSDAFELVNALGHSEDVVRLIEHDYKATGMLPDFAKAAQEVEEYLYEKHKSLANLKKMQEAFAPAPSPAQQRQPVMRTLTNKDTASIPADRRSRAMSAFYGTLKK